MKYYKLTDAKHKNMIIKQNDDEQCFLYRPLLRGWVVYNITEYSLKSSPVYKKYEKISELEAYEMIKKGVCPEFFNSEPLSEGDYQDFILKYGKRFSKDWQKFIRGNNGGKPKNSKHFITTSNAGKSEIRTFAKLLSFSAPPKNTFWARYDTSSNWIYVFFAIDEANNYIGYAWNPKEKPYICYLDTEVKEFESIDFFFDPEAFLNFLST